MCQKCWDDKKEKDGQGIKIKGECFCCSRINTKIYLMGNSSTFHNHFDRERFLEYEGLKYGLHCMICQDDLDDISSGNVRSFKACDSKDPKKDFEKEEFTHNMCISCYNKNKKIISEQKKSLFCCLCKREEFLEPDKRNNKCTIF